jgi:hypothetical protein
MTESEIKEEKLNLNTGIAILGAAYEKKLNSMNILVYGLKGVSVSVLLFS